LSIEQKYILFIKRGEFLSSVGIATGSLIIGRSGLSYPYQNNFQFSEIRIIVILFCICGSLSLVNAQSNTDQQSYCMTAMKSITAAECLDHVAYLASSDLAGRSPCDAGFDKSAAYVGKYFGKTGLLPLMEDSSFYQVFSVNRNVIQDGNEFALELLIPSPLGKDTIEIYYDIEDDFLPAGISSSCNMTTDAVFAGYGITSNENDWNDYKKLDVKGKAVMVLGGTPPLKDANFGSLYRVSRKAEFAKKAGASALLVVGKPIGSISNKQSVPVISISEQVANEILKGTGQDIKGLKEKIKEEQKSISLKIKHNVKIRINAEITQDCKTMNILGYIEGSDPDLRDEFIVIGAHVDHLGEIDGRVFHGANDNASGTAVVMEVAEALSLLKEAPKRSVLFIAFTGEEMGLLGSSYFVENPHMDISNIKAMINLDMVGSGDDAIMVVGGHSFPEFAQLFDTLAGQYIHVPIKRRWTSANSDHFPFHNAGIPSVFLYAMNGVPAYHSSNDKAETLNPEVMENVGRLVFMTVFRLANKESVSFRYVEQEK